MAKLGKSGPLHSRNKLPKFTMLFWVPFSVVATWVGTVQWPAPAGTVFMMLGLILMLSVFASLLLLFLLQIIHLLLRTKHLGRHHFFPTTIWLIFFMITFATLLMVNGELLVITAFVSSIISLLIGVKGALLIQQSIRKTQLFGESKDLL